MARKINFDNFIYIFSAAIIMVYALQQAEQKNIYGLGFAMVAAIIWVGNTYAFIKTGN